MDDTIKTIELGVFPKKTHAIARFSGCMCDGGLSLQSKKKSLIVNRVDIAFYRQHAK